MNDKWVSEMTDDEICDLAGAVPVCELQVDVDDICGERSRFRVERGPADPSYEPWESCEKHLGIVIAGLLEGREDVRAIVTVHWDEAER